MKVIGYRKINLILEVLGLWQYGSQNSLKKKLKYQCVCVQRDLYTVVQPRYLKVDVYGQKVKESNRSSVHRTEFPRCSSVCWALKEIYFKTFKRTSIPVRMKTSRQKPKGSSMCFTQASTRICGPELGQVFRPQMRQRTKNHLQLYPVLFTFTQFPIQ